MRMIINIQDTVLGSWHQITADRNIQYPHEWTFRIDGKRIPADRELDVRLRLVLLTWEDEFEGLGNKGDAL